MAGAGANHDGEGGDAVSSLSPDSNTSTSNPPASKRKRPTGVASSRGVANLTPEQLDRKRANDREAQRAIRERTKSHIDRLQQRIRELEGQQPYHDLQQIVRSKEAVLAENADIRARLEQALALVQPILRAPGGLNELAAAAERSPLPLLPSSRESTLHPNTHHADIASPQNGVISPPGTECGQYPPSHARHWPHSPPYEQPPPPRQAYTETRSDERLGVDFLLDNRQRGAERVDPALSAPQPPAPTAPSLAQYAPRLVPHLTLPRAIGATCPLDFLMLQFIHGAGAVNGVPLQSPAGPRYPNFTALVYPERQTVSHPLSKLFTDIIGTFPDISGLPEKVAVVYIMYLVTRWQIEPTLENYNRLPEWMTPRPSQLFVPHPNWVDHIPWPRLRDHMVGLQPCVPFDSFFISYTKTVSVNWPYEPRDCLLPASKLHPPHSRTSPVRAPLATVPGGLSNGRAPPQHGTDSPSKLYGNGHLQDDEQWVINPDFEAHLRDLSNWSLGPMFRVVFPEFADMVRIKEHGSHR